MDSPMINALAWLPGLQLLAKNVVVLREGFPARNEPKGMTVSVVEMNVEIPEMYMGGVGDRCADNAVNDFAQEAIEIFNVHVCHNKKKQSSM